MEFLFLNIPYNYVKRYSDLDQEKTLGFGSVSGSRNFSRPLIRSISGF